MGRRITSALLAACACGAGVHEVPAAAPWEEAAGASDPAYRLASSKPLYFWENHIEGAELTELRPDGTYRTISREHMGVGEADAGRWRQAASGELLLCSAYQFRFVQAGPLWVTVARREMRDDLQNLRDAVRAFLATHSAASFPSKEIEWPLGVEDYHRPSINSELYDREVTRAELAALAHAVDAYLASGDENLFWTTPRVYRGAVYLDGWWQVPRGRPRDAKALDSLHGEIDKGSSVLALLAIDEATFRASVRSPQPFVFFTGMNDCVGKALTSDEVRDAKPERVEPRCKSF